MYMRICDFNVGDVTIEYDVAHGEIGDLQIYLSGEDITALVSAAALNEVKERVTERCIEKGYFAESLEPEVDEDIA